MIMDTKNTKGKIQKIKHEAIQKKKENHSSKNKTQKQIRIVNKELHHRRKKGLSGGESRGMNQEGQGRAGGRIGGVKSGRGELLLTLCLGGSGR